VLLLLLVFLLLQVPYIQNLAKNKAVSYLQDKIGTKVEIDKFSLHFPKQIVLERIYFEDQSGDTLLAGDTLKIDITLLKLLKNEIEINLIDLRGITAHVHKNLQDSLYNFDYIIKAFVKQDKPASLDSTAAMRFSVSKINLDRIKVKYNDEVSGQDVDASLRHFDTEIKDFDFEHQKYTIPKITLSGFNATLKQTKAIPDKAVVADTFNLAPPFTYPDLTLGEIDISDIHIVYGNTITAIDSKLALEKLSIEFDSLDLPNQVIDIRLLHLQNTKGSFALGKTAQNAVEASATEVATTLKKGWTVQMEKLSLDSIDFKFDDLSQKKVTYGIDYNYLDLENLNAEITDISYNADSIAAKIKQLSVTDTSGLDLKDFHAIVFYDNNNVRLEDFVFETPESFVSDQLHITYPSLDSIAKDPGVLGISGEFQESRLAVSDLLLFAPSLRSRAPFAKNENAIIHLKGHVDGKISDLTFSDLEISGIGNIQLQATGTIKGMPDVNKSYFDIDIAHFSASARDITDFIPAGTIPSNISIPDQMSLQGTFKGSMKSFTTNMNLNSSFGTASLKATLKNITSKGRESYNGTINTDQFDVGKLIMREDKIGKVSITANFNGTGTDLKTANAQFDGVIREAQYNGYTYHDLSANGTAQNGDIELNAKMDDPNITLDLSGTANMTGQYPKVNLRLNIDSLNLQKLNFYEKDLRFHGLIIADLETADPDYLNGTIELSKAGIVANGKKYFVDTFSIVSVATEGEDTMDIRSAFLTAHVDGQYKLTEIMPALQGTISKYFNLQQDSVIAYDPQHINFTATVTRSPLIAEILPSLEEMEDVHLEGSFDSNKKEINIKGGVPRVKYKDYTIDDLDLNLTTENNALNYTFSLEQIKSPKLQIVNLSLSGKAQNDILEIKLLKQDDEQKDEYRVAGELTSAGTHFNFHMLPDGLLLNKQSWNVATDNSIQFGKAGIMVRNFNISNDGQSMVVNSSPQQFNAPLGLTFENFKIETLTRLVTKDSLLAGGIINGGANVRNLQTNPVFTADLNIQDFNFHGDTLGNVALKVNNETANTYAAEVNITGKGNEVKISGTYTDTGNENLLDLHANIVKLDMKSIQGFTAGELHDASGDLTGDFTIKGTPTAPEIRGNIRFRKAEFTITRFNAHYHLEDESIRFTPEGIQLNYFTLIDSVGNEAIVDGNIYTTNYMNYRFELDVNADNFQVLNSTRDHNKLYYGQLYMDIQMHIKGGINNPVVDGFLGVNDKTKLTIVVPQDDPGIIEREGIVQFVDMDTFKLTTIHITLDSLMNSDITGMDVAVEISIDKNAELNLIIDEANGDYLNVKGVGELTGGIDPSGKMTLAGLYKLKEGEYRFSFNQLKREFKIKEGSTISWTGEPLNADVDVTAIYVANAAPLSLVQSQMANADQNIINTYKQKLPFQVMLNMKGKLMKPDVTFDIDLPDQNYGVPSEVISTVQTKLLQLRAEPSELNKQVFAVLLLNRFIAENPFQNEAGGGGISSLARQSASKLLSEQLNNLVGGMIAGVELNFDINSVEDYSTGELKNRTDLTVGLTKQLLDDRLKVSVGSNFELEGTQEPNRKTTNIAGDVSAEYQLSKDGRYLLRAYRKDEYIIVQGQVIETGLGFVFTADYEKLKDLFAKKTDDQKLLQKNERLAKKEERMRENEE